VIAPLASTTSRHPSVSELSGSIRRLRMKTALFVLVQLAAPTFQLATPTLRTLDTAKGARAVRVLPRVYPKCILWTEEAPISGREPPSSSRLPVARFVDGISEKVSSQGRAGLISLVVETVLFWLIFLLPAALFLFHEQTGCWMPDRTDPTMWAAFTRTLSACYVFCKMPPIEAARWAWVFAMTPWISENLVDGDKCSNSNRCLMSRTNAHLYQKPPARAWHEI